MALLQTATDGDFHAGAVGWTPGGNIFALAWLASGRGAVGSVLADGSAGLGGARSFGHEAGPLKQSGKTGELRAGTAVRNGGEDCRSEADRDDQYQGCEESAGFHLTE
jgi:hypothetical protein